MDGVGISIIERPRPLPGHDTPNPTEHPYTLKCEEPAKVLCALVECSTRFMMLLYVPDGHTAVEVHDAIID